MAYDIDNFESKMRDTWKKICEYVGKQDLVKHQEQGVLSFRDLSVGLRGLTVLPPVAFTLDDWHEKV